MDDNIWLSEVLKRIDSTKLNDIEEATPDDANDPAASIVMANPKLT